MASTAIRPRTGLWPSALENVSRDSGSLFVVSSFSGCTSNEGRQEVDAELGLDQGLSGIRPLWAYASGSLTWRILGRRRGGGLPPEDS
jgi:hypothetical protein